MIERDFKDSKVGKIPKDWCFSSLASIGEVKMCKRIMKEQTSTIGDVPFYKIGTFGKEADAYISRDLFEQFKSMYPYPQKGSVLISASGTIGRTVVYDGEDAYYQDSNIIWIDNNEERVLNSFLKFYCEIIKWKSEKGGTISRLYKENLNNTYLAYPKDKNEQLRIVQALSDIDSLVSSLEILIEKKRNIKQGAMQILLSGKRRLDGFSDIWEPKRISEIGDTYNGLSGKTKEDFGDGECRYITFLNVLKNPIINEDILERVSVSPTENQNRVQKGDLFFNASSETPEEVGFCSTIINDVEDLYLNSFCFGFRLTDTEVFNVFLAYYFRCKEARLLMSRLANGVTRFNLSKKKMKASSILVPSTKKEQEAIARVLLDMDSEISILEKKLEKYHAIKRGMVQQLLTGKIRFI